MTTVYVITSGEYSDYHIVAVCSNEEKADTLCDALNKNLDSSSNRVMVEEYEIDEVADRVQQGFLPWRVVMERDGSSRVFRTGVPTDNFHDLKIRHNRPSNTYWLEGLVWAKDSEHAVKIANEKRSALIASNQWETEGE
jgi:hypothetical protein